jgi:hypothetical protein
MPGERAVMPVRTYQDVVEHLADHFDVKLGGRLRRDVRRAIDEAYRDLPQQAYWAYFRRYAIINTVASQTTGTIAYTNSSRTVTLSGATFPSTAVKYRILIGTAHYDIESYTDSTHVVLPEASNPGADVAASTAYTLYRNEYPLPTNFRRALGLMDTTYQKAIRIIPDAEQQALHLGSYGSPSVPSFACIRNTGESTGTLSLVFSCPPNAAIRYELLYDAFPRAFVIAEKYSTGTVSVSSASASLTGSSTVFPSNCAGCIIRLSSNASDEPTGPFGARPDGVDIDNPYAFQTSVLTYGSATALTLLDVANAAYSGVKYTLSDPLDIEDGAMFTAFLRLAEARYSRMARMEAKTVQGYELDAQKALIQALENDRRVVGDTGERWVDWRPTEVSDTE